MAGTPTRNSLLKSIFRADPKVTTVSGVVLLIAIGLPIFGLGFGSESGIGLSRYGVNLIGQIMCFAILALALDLIWGYGGVLSLGHGIFFALGGYLVAMHMVKVAYLKTGTPPDFMLFMAWHTLPGYYAGFGSALYTVMMVFVLATLISFVFGYVSFRSKVTGVYFALITQALTYVAMLFFFRNDTGFGGNNGMTGFVELLGFPLNQMPAIVGLATISSLTALVALICCAVLTRSPIGRMLVAVRDDEARLRFLGYNTIWIKLFAWCFSAVLAALAGMLYVPQVGIINPNLLSPMVSLEIAVWVAIGGRGTLVGAFVGATVIQSLKFWLTAFIPEAWPFVLAGLVLVVTVALPNGLLDIPALLQSKFITVRRWVKIAPKES